MTHLFEQWNRVSGRLEEAQRIALFLDFDGTLAFIRRRPEEVSIDSAARDALLALARNPRFHISIISGRRRADLCSRVRVPGIRCLGLYGWEGRDAVQLPARTHRALQCVKNLMGQLIAQAPHVWIEEKVHALSIHYRGAAEIHAARVPALLHLLITPFRNLLRIQQGRAVWEVIPRELGDKGTAVTRELVNSPGALPIYLGDDRPDEAAFAALRGGITIAVGAEHATRAQYRLTGVPEVRTFLRRLRTEFA
jgi:trehalose-phosphatase